MKEFKMQKKKLPVWAKILIVTGCVAVLLLAVFLLRDVKFISEYKRSLIRVVNSAVNDNERTDDINSRVVENHDFTRIDKDVPFKVTKPMWLPEGYELAYADYTSDESDIYNIIYTYVHKEDKDKRIEFVISSIDTLDKKGITVEFEEIQIDEMSVIVIESDKNLCQASYINNQGFELFVSGTISKETLIKIIENMS